jgi:hypothetical protein
LPEKAAVDDATGEGGVCGEMPAVTSAIAEWQQLDSEKPTATPTASPTIQPSQAPTALPTVDMRAHDTEEIAHAASEEAHAITEVAEHHASADGIARPVELQ